MKTIFSFIAVAACAFMVSCSGCNNTAAEAPAEVIEAAEIVEAEVVADTAAVAEADTIVAAEVVEATEVAPATAE